VAQAIRWELIADPRKYQKGFRDAEQSSERLSRTVKRVGGLIAGAFAGIAVGGFLKSAISEAREAQKVGRQTAAVIKATGGVARVSARDVDRLATALSNKAGVDDELIASGANLLLTFKGVRNEAGKGNRVFDQASSAILDMTAAMHNGEVSASGLKSSTILVGKALNDPIKGLTALTRVGVTFSKGQRDSIAAMVKAGDTMGAQKIILGELRSEFGGAAAAAADPWQRLGVLFGNIKEQLGTALLPVLGRVADWLSTTIPRAVDATTRAWGILVAAFKTGNVTQGGLVGFLQRIGTVGATIRDKVVPRVAEIAPKVLTAVGTALGGLATTVQSKLDQLKPNLVTFGKHLVTGVKTLGQPVLDALGVALRTGDYGPLGKAVGQAIIGTLRATGNLGAAVGGWVGAQFGKVNWFEVGKAVGAKAFPFVIGFSATLVDGLITAAREHPFDTLLFFASFLGVGKIGGVIAKLLGRIPFLRAFAPLFEGLNKLTGPLNNTIGRVLSAMGRAFLRGLGIESPQMGRRLARSFDGLRLRIWAFREGFGKATLGLVEGAGRGIRAGLGGLGRSLATVAAMLGRFVGRLLGPVVTSFRGAGGALIRGLGAGMRALYGAINAATGGAISRIVSPFRGAGSWLVARGRQAIDGLTRGLRAGLGALRGAAGAARDAVTSRISAMLATVRRVLNTLMGALERGASKLSIKLSLPRFQRGGTVPGQGTGDKVAALLEPGEVVIPNRQGDRRRLLRDARVAQRLGLDVAGDPDTLVLRMQRGGLVERTQGWIRAQDPKPYVWGGVGPRGFDCSGLAGAVYGILTGQAAYRRYFTTGTIGGFRGLRRGTGLYTIGVTPGTGHMAGNLAGLGFEARSTRAGILTGGAARDVMSFARQFYLPALGGALVGGGARGGGGGLLGSLLGGVVRALLAPARAGLRALPGPVGQIVRGAGNRVIDAAANYVSGLATSGGPGGAYPGGPGGGSRAANIALGQRMAAARGWAGAQWNSLHALWQGESGWNHLARNRSSGAYGIPQSLPASKMGAAANPPQSNPGAQIAWGLDYIRSRYGSPIVAYQRWLGRSPHWYGSGLDAVFRSPTLIGVGERGPEAVSVKPLGQGTRSGTVTIEKGAITVPLQVIGDVTVAQRAQMVRIAEDMGERLAAELSDALARRGSGV
jgi:hypothetical protein